MIERLIERLVYENRYIKVFDDRVRFADRSEGTYVRISPAERGRGVILVAKYNGRIAFVKTYRYAVGREQWGLPRGFSQGPSSLDTAHAELREEVGAQATEATLIGSLTPDSGLLTHAVDVYRMDVTQPPSEPEDSNEVIELTWLDEPEITNRIRAGAIDDGLTLAAWCLYNIST